MITDFDSLNKIWEPVDRPVIRTEEGDITWSCFADSVKILSQRIQETEDADWAVYFDHPGLFCIAFWALTLAGRNIHFYSVPPVAGSEDLPLLTDSDGQSRFPVCFCSVTGNEPVMAGRTGEADVEIILHTSGSTGEAKRVRKRLALIDREVEELHKLWGARFTDAETAATVSHQHFYGLLFTVLLPLVSGSSINNDRIAFPESLLKPGREKINLITSPAFLKRIGETEDFQQGGLSRFRLYSSGGFLPSSTALEALKRFGTPVTEIYGSTETGGIAWKESPSDDLWTPFGCVRLVQENSGNFRLLSEYMDETYMLDDALEIGEDGRFRLLGRLDSIVKVEDKRVSLNEIEGRILESGLASDAYACLMESKRQFIAVVIQLNERGREILLQEGKKEMNRKFRTWLASFFHPTILPKKWRYPDAIPRDSQGKMKIDIARAMLEEPLLSVPEVISSRFAGSEYEAVIRFPENYRYFDGHFPEMKILPALAQVDWVIKVVSNRLDRSIPVQQISRMKLKSPIFPDTHVRLTIGIHAGKSQISYEYTSEDGSKLFSSGRIQTLENIL